MTDVPVFVDGSLLSPQVLNIVLGRAPDRVDAELEGYSRHPIIGRCYPAVRPSQGKSVCGCLLQSLTASELVALDAFEDPAYERCLLPVTLSNGSIIEARVWAQSAENVIDLDLSKDWDYEHFLAANEEPYLIRCTEWANDFYNSTN